MHEQFCNFHGIKLNLNKSNYMKMNAASTQLQWDGRGDFIDGEEDHAQLAHAAHHKNDAEGKEACKAITRAREEGLALTNEDRNKIERARYRLLQKGTRYKRAGGQGAVLKELPEGRKHIKYLGVYFEADKGWKKQRQHMNARMNKLTKQLSEANPTLEQALYAINSKIIPSVMYGAQVAVIPKGECERWDANLRRLIRKAGGLPMSLPPDLFHLPREEGGLGLRSCQDVMDETRTKLHYQAMNDEGAGTTSIHAKVVRAAWKRMEQRERSHSERGSVCDETLRAMQRLGLALRYTQPQRRLKEVELRDLRAAQAAEAAPQGATVNLYTDGSQKGEAAGWGVVRVDSDMTGRRHKGEWNGRLSGHQDNYTAEATGILEALMKVAPHQDATLYVDNAAAIGRAQKSMAHDPRGRSKDAARATWRRVEALIQNRKLRDAHTKMEWVHSHVEEAVAKSEGGAKSKGKKQDCACGGGEHHDKNHPHHVGNDLADQAAKEGRQKPLRQDMKEYEGEETYTMECANRLCQGDITQAIKDAAKKRRIRLLGEATSTKARQWHQAYKQSDKTIRKAIMKKTEASTRFKVRAMADALPTYKHESKRAKNDKGGDYRAMYADLLGEGECKRCWEKERGCEEVEDMNHMLVTCPQARKIRLETIRKIRAIWQDHQVGDHWDIMGYLDSGTEEWQLWWGWVGLVPITATKRIQALPQQQARAATAAITKSAIAISNSASAQWQARNTEVGEWEEAVGIRDNKTEIKKKRITVKSTEHLKVGRGGRRGRPPKPHNELSEKYREAKEKRTRMEELRVHMSRVDAESVYKREKAKLKEGERRRRIREEERITQTAVPVAVEDRAKQFNKIPQGKVRKKAKLCLSREARARISKWRDPKEDGVCAVQGCNREATVDARWCTEANKSRRCEGYNHEWVRCTGILVECECMAEKNKQVRDRGPKIRTQKCDNRSMQVHIKDEIEVECEDGTRFRGVVTYPIWNGCGGYRLPDAMMIENEDTQVEVSMTDPSWNIYPSLNNPSEVAAVGRDRPRVVTGSAVDKNNPIGRDERETRSQQDGASHRAAGKRRSAEPDKEEEPDSEWVFGGEEESHPRQETNRLEHGEVRHLDGTPHRKRRAASAAHNTSNRVGEGEARANRSRENEWPNEGEELYGAEGEGLCGKTCDERGREVPHQPRPPAPNGPLPETEKDIEGEDGHNTRDSGSRCSSHNICDRTEECNCGMQEDGTGWQNEERAVGAVRTEVGPGNRVDNTRGTHRDDKAPATSDTPAESEPGYMHRDILRVGRCNKRSAEHMAEGGNMGCSGTEGDTCTTNGGSGMGAPRNPNRCANRDAVAGRDCEICDELCKGAGNRGRCGVGLTRMHRGNQPAGFQQRQGGWSRKGGREGKVRGGGGCCESGLRWDMDLEGGEQEQAILHRATCGYSPATGALGKGQVRTRDKGAVVQVWRTQWKGSQAMDVACDREDLFGGRRQSPTLQVVPRRTSTGLRTKERQRAEKDKRTRSDQQSSQEYGDERTLRSNRQGDEASVERGEPEWAKRLKKRHEATGEIPAEKPKVDKRKRIDTVATFEAPGKSHNDTATRIPLDNVTSIYSPLLEPSNRPPKACQKFKRQKNKRKKEQDSAIRDGEAYLAGCHLAIGHAKRLRREWGAGIVIEPMAPPAPARRGRGGG